MLCISNVVFCRFVCSEMESSVDAPQLSVPPIEVLVKILILIAAPALLSSSRACIWILLCAHHPIIVSSARHGAMWKVLHVLKIKLLEIVWLLTSVELILWLSDSVCKSCVSTSCISFGRKGFNLRCVRFILYIYIYDIQFH